MFRDSVFKVILEKNLKKNGMKEKEFGIKLCQIGEIHHQNQAYLLILYQLIMK